MALIGGGGRPPSESIAQAGFVIGALGWLAQGGRAGVPLAVEADDEADAEPEPTADADPGPPGPSPAEQALANQTMKAEKLACRLPTRWINRPAA